MSPEAKPPRKERTVYNASQRVQAVLSVWTERRRPVEVCRELNITSALLADWQQRAMQGMLQALQPRQSLELDRGPALTAKLEQLLNRQAQAQQTRLAKLEKRLARFQPEAVGSPPAKEK